MWSTVSGDDVRESPNGQMCRVRGVLSGAYEDGSLCLIDHSIRKLARGRAK
jgi:hypothetical protein